MCYLFFAPFQFRLFEAAATWAASTRTRSVDFWPRELETKAGRFSFKRIVCVCVLSKHNKTLLSSGNNKKKKPLNKHSLLSTYAGLVPKLAIFHPNCISPVAKNEAKQTNEVNIALLLFSLPFRCSMEWQCTFY